LALGAGMVLAGVANAAESDWCRSDGNWNERQERFCEVREHTLGASGRLSVDARPNGGIEVEGWDRNEIRLEAKVSAQAESESEPRQKASQVTIETSNTVRAEGPSMSGRRSWSVSYRLHVPRNAELTLNSMNGGISVRATRGNVDLQTSNGGLNLDDVGGKVHGRTTNGGVNVRLTGNAWPGEGLDLRTTNGGVKLQVPEGYNAHLETGTTNGQIRSDIAVMVQGRIDRQLSVEPGKGGAPISVFTTNGGVSLSRR
jgi:hypothetical protein